VGDADERLEGHILLAVEQLRYVGARGAEALGQLAPLHTSCNKSARDLLRDVKQHSIEVPFGVGMRFHLVNLFPQAFHTRVHWCLSERYCSLSLRARSSSRLGNFCCFFRNPCVRMMTRGP